jgi:hypothetical protein
MVKPLRSAFLTRCLGHMSRQGEMKGRRFNRIPSPRLSGVIYLAADVR